MSVLIPGSSSDCEQRKDSNSGSIDQEGNGTSAIPSNAAKQQNKGGRHATKYDKRHTARRMTRRAYKLSGIKHTRAGRPRGVSVRCLKSAAKKVKEEELAKVFEKLNLLSTFCPDVATLQELLGTNMAKQMFGDDIAKLSPDNTVPEVISTMFGKFGKEKTMGRMVSKSVMGMMAESIGSTRKAADFFKTPMRYVRKAVAQAKSITVYEAMEIAIKAVNVEIRTASMAVKKATVSELPACGKMLEELNEKKQELLETQHATGLKSRHVLKMEYPVKTTRMGIDVLEMQIYGEHFEEKSTNKSGDKTNLRRIPVDKWEFLAELHGEFPMRLRSLALNRPDLLTQIENDKKPLNRFHSSLLSAVDAGRKDGFNESQEISTRTQAYTARYVAALHGKRQNSTKEQVDSFDNSTKHHLHEIDAVLDQRETISDTCYYPAEVDSRTYWKVLKFLGYRYTLHINDTQCKLCDEYKPTKLLDERATAKQAYLMEQQEKLKVKIKVAELECGIERQPDQNARVPHLVQVMTSLPTVAAANKNQIKVVRIRILAAERCHIKAANKNRIRMARVASLVAETSQSKLVRIRRAAAKPG